MSDDDGVEEIPRSAFTVEPHRPPGPTINIVIGSGLGADGASISLDVGAVARDLLALALGTLARPSTSRLESGLFGGSPSGLFGGSPSGLFGGSPSGLFGGSPFGPAGV